MGLPQVKQRIGMIMMEAGLDDMGLWAERLFGGVIVGRDVRIV